MGVGGFIGVFDSGVGGLSVWREIVRQLPYERTLYVADQAHVPYGCRSLDEVREFAERITRFLLDQGAGIIVIASNTTSAAALYHLRETFPDVPFVGMEPALKPAIEQTRTGAVGVIATPATFQGELFASLVKRWTEDVCLLSQACPGLVDAVESGALDCYETEALLERYLSPMIEADVDQLVLGCTHYPFLRPVIERLMGPGTAVIDPAPAVARQVAHVLIERQPELPFSVDPNTCGHNDSKHTFYTSGDVTVFTHLIAQLMGFTLEDRLDVRPVAWLAGRLELQPRTM
jgi:glutamate racemase